MYAYCIQYDNFLYEWNAWPSTCQNNRAYYKEYCILQYSVVGLSNMQTMWDVQIFLQDGCSNCVVKAGNAMVILLPEAMMQHPVPLESVWVWEKMERRREGRSRSRDWEVKPLWFLEWMKAQTALCGLLRKYRGSLPSTYTHSEMVKSWLHLF